MAKTLTIQEFFRRFPNDDACIDHLFGRRFGNGFICPKCRERGKFRKLPKQTAYGCICGHTVYPMQGSVFGSSRTPLEKWFYAIFLFTMMPQGVPVKELQRQLGVSYRTAFRMAHAIRSHMTSSEDFATPPPQVAPKNIRGSVPAEAVERRR